MSGYAAGSSYASNAYNPPVGTTAIGVGKATYHFLNIPITFSFWEFLGVVFIIFIIARHWGRFINDVAG
jgi:hypothetical protein